MHVITVENTTNYDFKLFFGTDALVTDSTATLELAFIPVLAVPYGY